jgi:hypothetical protein
VWGSRGPQLWAKSKIRRGPRPNSGGGTDTSANRIGVPKYRAWGATRNIPVGWIVPLSTELIVFLDEHGGLEISMSKDGKDRQFASSDQRREATSLFIANAIFYKELRLLSSNMHTSFPLIRTSSRTRPSPNKSVNCEPRGRPIFTSSFV